jgi:hypothetical protein
MTGSFIESHVAQAALGRLADLGFTLCCTGRRSTSGGGFERLQPALARFSTGTLS